MTPRLDRRSFRQALGRFASGVTVVTTVAGKADHAPLLYYRSRYGALLRSTASEKSVVAFRDAIVEDAGRTHVDLSSGGRTTRA